MTLLLQGAGLQAVAGSPPVPFTYAGSLWDGSDIANRGDVLSGAADTSFITVSLFMRNTNTSTAFILNAGDFNMSVVQNDSSQEVAAYFQDTGGNNFGFTIDGPLNDGNKHHILFSVDLNHGSGSRVVTASVDGSAVGTTSFSDSGSAFQAAVGSSSEWYLGNLWVGDLAEVLVKFGTYMDATDSGNIAKFRDGSNNPVDPGADGSTAFGSAATMYFHLDDAETANNFATNAGSGGGFSLSGTLVTSTGFP